MDGNHSDGGKACEYLKRAQRGHPFLAQSITHNPLPQRQHANAGDIVLVLLSVIDVAVTIYLWKRRKTTALLRLWQALGIAD